jgi:nitroreductase
MDVFDAVRTILAVRRYKDQPVLETVRRRIVEAGRLTASAKNAQPWHFIVVQDRSMLCQLGALVPTGPYVAQAAFAIVKNSRHITRAVTCHAPHTLRYGYVADDPSP